YSTIAPPHEKIVPAGKQISDGPIRFLVNTHVHGDHTGGNENFGKLGVVILSRPQLRARLVKPSPAANGTTPPSAPPARPPRIVKPPARRERHHAAFSAGSRPPDGDLRHARHRDHEWRGRSA